MRWHIVIMGLAVLILGACTATRVTSTSSPATDTPPPPTITPPPSPSPTSESLLPEEPSPAGAEREFSTDFSRHTVPYSEILSGGPPKDGIPAIDEPKFVSVEEADAWLEPQEPVILVQVGDEARAYPIQILTWHEIVNDAIGDVL